MILKLNGMIGEREVFRSYRGLGEWFVRQPNIHTFQAVHRAEDGRETVIGSYASFDEAFWAADRAADEAHQEFVGEAEDGLPF
ncbi:MULTISPECIES: hypothetical protein [Meiothermus]|uniref:Uncharacterized protein n=3 Tax=Meiothermus TaxID=65551 RepID=A0A806DF15_MEIRD|nr:MULTISPECIES: hypothetical protein [Meiothermus]ADD27279.1 hypothetical protein Mrub_0504 [Meiothermus ruber DSM 1279]GAO74206.1 putative uncharacterized protein [Meiothermus ruber H328]GEM83152.1 hypothetical protein MHY01S_13180 [Meiothermus hypogaeus NBRC 106114]GIW29002.1 MAG: hypothetical protein KatS3mg070_2365 [Meiothermus sp.]